MHQIIDQLCVIDICKLFCLVSAVGLSRALLFGSDYWMVECGTVFSTLLGGKPETKRKCTRVSFDVPGPLRHRLYAIVTGILLESF